MEAFIGTWKLIEDQDYDKYLRAIGTEEEVIAVSNVLKPTVTISQEDGIVTINRQSGTGTEEVSFELGKEFHSIKKDGRYCKIVVYLDGDQLVRVENWNSKEARSTFEIKDGKLIRTVTFKDITAVRTFTRV